MAPYGAMGGLEKKTVDKFLTVAPGPGPCGDHGPMVLEALVYFRPIGILEASWDPLGRSIPPGIPGNPWDTWEDLPGIPKDIPWGPRGPSLVPSRLSPAGGCMECISLGPSLLMAEETKTSVWAKIHNLHHLPKLLSSIW